MFPRIFENGFPCTHYICVYTTRISFRVGVVVCVCVLVVGMSSRRTEAACRAAAGRRQKPWCGRCPLSSRSPWLFQSPRRRRAGHHRSQSWSFPPYASRNTRTRTPALSHMSMHACAPTHEFRVASDREEVLCASAATRCARSFCVGALLRPVVGPAVPARFFPCSVASIAKLVWPCVSHACVRACVCCIRRRPVNTNHRVVVFC